MAIAYPEAVCIQAQMQTMLVGDVTIVSEDIQD
jgi:hypothetical protein